MDTIGISQTDFLSGGISMTFDLEKARAEVATASARRFSESREQARIFCAEEILPDALDEIERLRAALDESEQILAHKTKTATHWYEEGLKTRADLVQSKRVVEQQAARLKELESSLDEAEALTKKNADLMNAYLARIAELEDALVEGLTNFLHYRASCYDPARRCPYAKECDDCSTWDACGHVEKSRSEARRQLQAEGKIGPDAKPRVWQITEERKETLRRALEEYKIFPNDQAVLRAMLTEAGQ